MCNLAANGWRTRARSAAPWSARSRFCDEDGNELPQGEAGTVYFADGRPFQYHNDPEKTAEARNAKGWTTLGDVGYVDADGFLLPHRPQGLHDHLGRGEHLPAGGREPSDHPSQGHGLRRVRRAQPRLRRGSEGRRPAARHGRCRPGARAEELLAFCRQHLSAIKCPRSIDFEAELPRHPTGKLYKRLLRDRYWPKRGEGRRCRKLSSLLPLWEKVPSRRRRRMRGLYPRRQYPSPVSNAAHASFDPPSPTRGEGR